MWVEIVSIDGQIMSGTLANDPDDMPGLEFGEALSFPRHFVIAVSFADAASEEILPKEPRKQYWDRCLVDVEVLNGDARVGFIYREEPEAERANDEDPDSGWRIRADVDQLTDDHPSGLAKLINSTEKQFHGNLKSVRSVYYPKRYAMILRQFGVGLIVLVLALSFVPWQQTSLHFLVKVG